MRPDPPSNAELLRSLGRLVRGLSALFWGLPVALIICFQTAKTEFFKSFGVIPPLAVMAWLLYGLWQMRFFQRQERIWMSALDRAQAFALVNCGLCPFLYWWNRMPDQPFFTAMVGILAASGLLFLSDLNLVLRRLTAMLPDEGLRQEVGQFTALNRYLVLITFSLLILFFVWLRFPSLAPPFADFLMLVDRVGLWLIIFLVLLPLAMTMALLWKIKEVILDSIFGQSH
jgi:hypothetical protein